jgi:hypothetical protein
MTLAAADLAQAVRILARAVDVDVLVAVLDERDHQAASGESGHQPQASPIASQPLQPGLKIRRNSKICCAVKIAPRPTSR